MLCHWSWKFALVPIGGISTKSLFPRGRTAFLLREEFTKKPGSRFTCKEHRGDGRLPVRVDRKHFGYVQVRCDHNRKIRVLA